jgi:hypothetical protein
MTDLARARVVASWWHRLRSWRLPIGRHADYITPLDADERVRSALNRLVTSWWEHDRSQRTYIETLTAQLRAAGIRPADAPYIRPAPTMIPSGGMRAPR